MPAVLIPILQVVDMLLGLFYWAILIWVVMSWLVQFNVINSRNEVVRAIWSALSQLVEPTLKPIRRFLPLFGSVDLSPIVLIAIIWLIRSYLRMLGA